MLTPWHAMARSDTQTPLPSLFRTGQRPQRKSLYRRTMMVLSLTILAALSACGRGLHSPSQHPAAAVATISTPDSSATAYVIVYPRGEDELPRLTIRMRQGDGEQHITGSDLQRVEGDFAWRTDIGRLTHAWLEVSASLSPESPLTGESASVEVRLPVMPLRNYRVLVALRRERPRMFMVDSVVATPLLDLPGRPPGDSLFVAWGYSTNRPS